MSNRLYFNLPSGRPWLTLRRSTNPLSAAGGPVPQILLPLEARLTLPGTEGQILRLAVDASIGTVDSSVLVGRGEIGPLSHLGTDDYLFSATVACPHESLALLLDPPPGSVKLVLRFAGLLRFRHHSREDDKDWRGVEEPDTWHILTVGDNIHQLETSFARSDWYEQVVEPMKLGRYLIAPLRLPDPSRVTSWNAALGHLDEARRALTAANAPAVFGRCRAAVDALPGDKTKIFEAMPEGKKRDEIDALTKAIGKYIHSGRHVLPGVAQEQPGEFPVDQRDAVFAYHMTALLLSHVAGLVLDV